MADWLIDMNSSPSDEDINPTWDSDEQTGEVSINEEDLEIYEDLISSALEELEKAPEPEENSYVVIDETDAGEDESRKEIVQESEVVIERAELDVLRKKVESLTKQLEQWKKKSKSLMNQQKDKITKGGEINKNLKSRIETIKKERDAARAEAETNKKNWTEAAAAYQNLQRRSKVKLDEFIELERASIIRQILPVFDNLKRPLEYSEPTEALLDGVKLIHKQFEEVLEGWKVKQILSDGEVFDPYFHEAVMRIPVENVAANTIVEVLLEGYCIEDKVLRPAKVTVSYKVKKDEVVENKEQSENIEQSELEADETEFSNNDLKDSKIHINSVQSGDIDLVEDTDRSAEVGSEEVEEGKTDTD